MRETVMKIKQVKVGDGFYVVDEMGLKGCVVLYKLVANDRVEFVEPRITNKGTGDTSITVTPEWFAKRGIVPLPADKKYTHGNHAFGRCTMRRNETLNIREDVYIFRPLIHLDRADKKKFTKRARLPRLYAELLNEKRDGIFDAEKIKYFQECYKIYAEGVVADIQKLLDNGEHPPLKFTLARDTPRDHIL